MPQTPILGLPFENLGNAPGDTLHGGESGTSPILAERVEDDVYVPLAAGIADVAADLANFEASAAQVIDTIDTGNGTNTTEFSAIPSTFRDLMIIWRGASDGSGQLDSLAIRFNGDGTDSYRSRLSRNTAAGAYTSSAGLFSVNRGGQVGTHGNRRSGGLVLIPDYTSTSGNRFVSGTSFATGQSAGDNIYTTQAGGYWFGSAVITSIRIWVSGQLWNGNPHIKLIGIP